VKDLFLRQAQNPTLLQEYVSKVNSQMDKDAVFNCIREKAISMGLVGTDSKDPAGESSPGNDSSLESTPDRLTEPADWLTDPLDRLTEPTDWLTDPLD
jgi:hypothetical protein